MDAQIVAALIDNGGLVAILLFILYGLRKFAGEFFRAQREMIENQKQANKEMLVEFRSATDKDRTQQQQYMDRMLERNTRHDTKLDKVLEHVTK